MMSISMHDPKKGRSLASDLRASNLIQVSRNKANSPASSSEAYVVHWDEGDNDHWNPRSHSKWKKWVITLVVANASFCVTVSSSMYTSTFTQIENQFGNSREISNLGLSLYVLGLSLGPMLFGPLSEFYGRRPIYLVSWLFYIIWNIPIAVAGNIQTIMVSRFLGGFSGSAFLAVSGGTVGDLFSKEHLQLPMAIFTAAPFIGPSIGPFIGNFINYYTSWHWTFWVILIWSVTIGLALLIFVPETHHQIALKHKAKWIRKKSANDDWQAPVERMEATISGALRRSLLRPFQLLFFDPMCLALCLYSALLLGIIYLFFVAFPLIFEQYYQFNRWQVGLIFLAILVGMIVAVATDPIWTRVRRRLMHKEEQRTRVTGHMEPEIRLPPTILGSLFVPTGLFIFAWTTYPHVHWIAPAIGAALFGFGFILSFTGILTFLVDAYPTYAASAMAANDFLRSLFAAAFPLFGEQMYKKMDYNWASCFLALLTLIMMPFPILFFKYGKTLRAKSKFAKET